MIKSIGVLGCGWLGLPLAKRLLSKDFMVKGTSTTENKLKYLNTTGIDSYHIELKEDSIKGPIKAFLEYLDLIVINVPPGLRDNPEKDYTKEIRHLFNAVADSEVKHVIFISSISVYGDAIGEVDENTKPIPTTLSGKQLLAAEQLFMDSTGLNATFIRFGGLIGKDRHPVNQLSGKSGLQNGEDLVNLIPLEDCLGMIEAIIDNEWWNTIFNGVFPEHPKKAYYYTAYAKYMGLKPPQYITTNIAGKSKKVISANFKERGYEHIGSIWPS